MKEKQRLSILNYLLPVIMILIGLRHFAKHGMGPMTIIPIVLGTFALYLVLFNHLLLKRIEVVIIKLWYPVGQLITIILLTITFYLIFMPAGFLLRLFKKNILNRNFKTDQLSYWVDRPIEQNNYTQQF